MFPRSRTEQLLLVFEHTTFCASGCVSRAARKVCCVCVWVCVSPCKQNCSWLCACPLPLSPPSAHTELFWFVSRQLQTSTPVSILPCAPSIAAFTWWRKGSFKDSHRHRSRNLSAPGPTVCLLMDFLSVSNKDYIWSQIVLQVTLAQIKLVRSQWLISMVSAESGDIWNAQMGEVGEKSDLTIWLIPLFKNTY